MNPAGAKHGVESAEVRNSIAGRPQSKQQRGFAMESRAGTKCGKSAEKVRNHSNLPVSFSLPAQSRASSSVCTGALDGFAPDLVTASGTKTRREVDRSTRPIRPASTWARRQRHRPGLDVGTASGASGTCPVSTWARRLCAYVPASLSMTETMSECWRLHCAFNRNSRGADSRSIKRRNGCVNTHSA